MDSFRLKINNNDLSTATVETATDVCGYTVINAEKGSAAPIRIPANSASKIQDLFGAISADYPEIYEATVFNTEYDLYISAPCTYTETKIPVAYISGRGIHVAKDLVSYTSNVEELVDGFDPMVKAAGINDFEAATSYDVLMDSRYPKENGISTASNVDSKVSPKWMGDNSGLLIHTNLTLDQIKTAFDAESEFTLRLNNLPSKLGSSLSKEYVKSYVDFKAYIDGETVTLKQTYNYIDSNGDYKSEEVVVGSGSYVDTAKTNFGFYIVGGEPSTTAAGSKNNLLTKSYVNQILASNYSSLALCFVKSLKGDEIFGTIFPKYPSERSLHVGFEAFNKNKGESSSSVTSRNIIKMSNIYETGAFHNTDHTVAITGSLNASEATASGSYIGFNSNNTDYTNQNLVCVSVVKPFTSVDELTNTSMSGYPSFDLCGGIRVTGDHAAGWKKAEGEEYADVDVFFDSERHEVSSDWSVPTSSEFFGLAKKHKLSGYIYNCTVSPDLLFDDAGTQNSNAKVLDCGENYWNICNEGIVVLSDTGAKFMSPMTGARALMQCRIIENRWGGVAPMYLNQGTPSMGGQLPVPYVSKLRYKYDKEDQELLDELNFNPIINDRTYGVMVVGQKTSKSGATTDWSYIGHVCSFLTFQKEVRTGVMIPQLGKPNNPYYRSLRADQVNQMLNNRTNGSDRIWADAVVDTSTADGVNDTAAQRARKFIIDVKVKVDTFSEYVVLNFTNVDQDTSLTSAS